jgi:hypothetical protein
VGSPSGWELVSRCPREPSRPGSVWRTWCGHRRESEPAGTDSMPCSGRRSLSLPRASPPGAGRGLADGGRRTRGYGAVRACVGGGVLAGWAIRAPQGQASQTYPLSFPLSRSPYRWCSATNATRALRASGMGPGLLPQDGTEAHRQGVRSASGRRHDLGLSVVATRQLCLSPGSIRG